MSVPREARALFVGMWAVGVTIGGLTWLGRFACTHGIDIAPLLGDPPICIPEPNVVVVAFYGVTLLLIPFLAVLVFVLAVAAVGLLGDDILRRTGDDK